MRLTFPRMFIYDVACRIAKERQGEKEKERNVVDPRYWPHATSRHRARATSEDPYEAYDGEDRWIWSALGIHRVPYEFWKVGTWKPAVNARSTDSRSLPHASSDRRSVAGIFLFRRADLFPPHRNSLQPPGKTRIIPTILERILQNTLGHCRSHDDAIFSTAAPKMITNLKILSYLALSESNRNHLTLPQ